jgi:hypothetical protein
LRRWLVGEPGDAGGELRTGEPQQPARLLCRHQLPDQQGELRRGTRRRGVPHSAVSINGQPITADPSNLLIPAVAASNDVEVTITDRYESAGLVATGGELEAPLLGGLAALLFGAVLLAGATRIRHRSG